MPPPRRRTRRRPSKGGTGGARGSFLARTSGGTRRPKGKVASGGTSTGRESGIAASQKTNKIKSLEQSVGSLDRRINKALEAGDTNTAKDLRSRLNKFTTQLGDERAKQIDGGVARTRDGSIIRTSSGRPVLTSSGLAAFRDTKDKDFLDPTRNLINRFPEQYGQMYPITDQLRQGLPGIRIAKEFLGMKDKEQKLTEQDLPGIRYPLDREFGAGEGEPFFGGRSRDPDFDSYPYIAPIEPVTITDLEDDKSVPFTDNVLPYQFPVINSETRSEVVDQTMGDIIDSGTQDFATLDEEFQKESAEYEKRKAEEPTFKEKFPYQVAGPDALPSFFNLFGQNDSDEVVQLPPSDSAEFNVAADNIASRLLGSGYNLSPEIITNLYQQGFLDPNINYFPNPRITTSPLVDEALASYYQSLQ